MRARMRSPRCIRSRCPAVYAVDDCFGELGMRVDSIFLPAFLIPLLLARRDDKMTSPPLPPDIWCLCASLGVWRIEGYPLEGISFVILHWKPIDTSGILKVMTRIVASET